MEPQTRVLIIEASLCVRCPDFRDLIVCTVIEMGPCTSVLTIEVFLFSEVS